VFVDLAVIQSNDRVWYFFCRHDYKFPNSKRVNRTTKNGNWKVTGKVRNIKRRGTNEVIGTKKNLVFLHKCPDSKKTRWVIHEFQAKTSPPDEVLYNTFFLVLNHTVYMRLPPFLLFASRD